MPRPKVLRLHRHLSDGHAYDLRNYRISGIAIHGHDFGEIFWVGRGSGWHLFNGRRTPLAPGHIGLIFPNDAHGFEITPGEPLFLTNLAYPAKVARFLRDPDFRAIRRWLGPHPNRQPIRRIGAPLQAWIDAESRALVRPAPPVVLKSFLLRLLCLLEEEKIPDSRRAPDWLERARSEMARPENFRAGLGRFYSLCGRCPAQIARTMKAHGGETPTEFLQRVRVEWATGELVLTDRKIFDIAQDSGWENLSHFYKQFAKRHGMPPDAYRRNRAPFPGASA